MENKFKPEQLKQSPEFVDYQDALSVILDPDEIYTKTECKKALDEFLKILDREVI